MYKNIWTASALIAAGIVVASGPVLAQKKAEKPAATLNGYFAQGFQIRGGEASAAVGDTGGFDAFGDGEIHFNARAALDNGIKVHGRVELESTSEDAHSDEQWLRVYGAFGQVIIGQDDSVGQKMTTGYVGSWATSQGQNLCFDKNELIPAPAGFNAGGAGFCVRLDGSDSDDQKISYITPRISGFQVGASYARDLAAQAADDTVNQDAGAGYTDFVSVAANFDRKFGDVRFAVAGGYNQADAPTGVAGSSNSEAMLVAALVDFNGFRLAAGYYDVFNQNDGNGATVGVSDAGSGFDGGASVPILTLVVLWRPS